MAASPEFYKPPATAFSSSPCASPLPAEDYRYGTTTTCRTPTGSGISYLKEPTTCPPAPRKRKPLCKKRLFKGGDRDRDTEAKAPLIISLHLDDLERVFRPRNPNAADKRRRSASATADKQP